jgi:hypothetical protein
MDARQQAERLASRCVALVIYHEHARKTRSLGQETVSEIRAVAVEAREDGISWPFISAEVLRELEARYAPKEARRLHGEFMAVVDDEMLA